MCEYFGENIEHVFYTKKKKNVDLTLKFVRSAANDKLYF